MNFKGIETMKIQTTISISDDLLKILDNMLNNSLTLSDVIEKALREYVQKNKQKNQDDQDLEILNKNADALNEEAIDVLQYQVSL